MQKAIADRYPLSYSLEDGAKVTFSLMSTDDREALSEFIGDLPRHDLLYLQVDVTQPEVLERWLNSVDNGDSIGLCAYDPAGLVGYASLQMSDDADRRSGEIRVNINQGYRSRGLGRGLTTEIIHIARQVSLDIVTARMLSDQHGAKAAFKRLGFAEERLLEGYVQDAGGASKDLLVMASTLH